MFALAYFSLNGCHAGDDDGVRSQRRSVDLAPAAIARLESLGYETWVQERHIPKRTGVLLHEPEQAAGGFVLFANRGPCNAVLLDREGDVVQRWSGPTPGFWSDVELADDGSLFVIGATDERRENQQSARFLRKLDWDSNVLWQADFPAHHDVELLPDGRVLTLSSTVRTIQDGLVERVLLDDEVVITSPAGEVLESHSIYDAYRNSADIAQPVLALRPVTIGDSQAVDAFHSNSVAFIDVPHLEGEHPLYAKGNILISMRHQSRIAVLNRSTGEIVWSWGKGVLDAQHSARMLEDGNIIVFDNGYSRKSSRILEIDPRTETVVWEFGGPDPIHFYTPGGGATQRLPNGNTLITETRKGRLFEVTSDGEIVWKFVNPAVDPGQSLRATIHSSKWVPATRVIPILERLSLETGTVPLTGRSPLSWARESANVVVALALSLAVAPSHAAETPADATSGTAAAATIDRLHATLADAIERADTLGFAGRLELLAPALTAAFDQPFMAEKSIGAHWRGLSEDDRARWLKVFAHHGAATYAARLNQDKGQKFERIGEAPGGRDTLAVTTKISTPDEPDVSLTYRLRQTDNGWQVIDMYLDGTISELAIRRSDYAAILRKGGLDALIESLESKTADFAAGATPE